MIHELPGLLRDPSDREDLAIGFGVTVSLIATAWLNALVGISYRVSDAALATVLLVALFVAIYHVRPRLGGDAA